MPKVLPRKVTPEISSSPALSLFARPGDGSIKARRVAVLVADGCDAGPLKALVDRLTAEGAVPRFVSATLGSVKPASGSPIEIDVSIDAAPAVLYDAVALPGGGAAVSKLSADGRVLEFIKDQYRHCKPILVFGESTKLLAACGIALDTPDPGIVISADAKPAGITHFVSAIAKHRHFDRETDPPRV
jgi:catalase